MRKGQKWLTWVAVIVSLAMGGINAQAQAIGVLHSFSSTNTDGSTPEGRPLLIGSTLYGVTFNGGGSSDGVVYQVSTNGAGFSLLYSFTGGTNGANPLCTLVSAGSSLYGMTFNGGVDDGGVVFGINTNGPVYSLLHTFLGGDSDGLDPFGSLALVGTTLYGMTVNGGTNDDGVIFRIGTTGSDFSVLHSFAGGTNDGAFPNEGVIVNGTTLYGTAYNGGTNDAGIVFAYNTALTSNAFTILHHFAGGTNDGANPTGPLTLNGSTLYGLTTEGGTNNFGVVFAVGTGGSGYSVLHHFLGGTNDGAYPQFGPLVVTNSAIYGATEGGGTNNIGVLFQMNTDGTDFAVVHSFSGGTNDGAVPFFGPLLNGSVLYGTTPNGGSNDLGVVYGAPASLNACVFVPGNSSSGVFVTNVVAGQLYTYEASGCITFFPTNAVYSANPQGLVSTNGCDTFDATPPVATNGFLCSGLTNWSLVGEINGGDCFQMGAAGLFVASASGPLTLYFNDNDYNDNSGSFTVCITPVNCTNATNVLTQVSAIEIVSNNVVITVPTIICEMYQLQYSSAMVPTNWTDIGSAVAGTGNPVQLIDYGVVTTPQPVTWQIEGWPSNQNWGGPQGSPATTNNNVITLTGQDVLSVQVFTAPLTISYDVVLTAKSTTDGIIELYFVPTWESSNIVPTNGVELLWDESQSGNDNLVVQVNQVNPPPQWGPVSYPLTAGTTYHYSVSVAVNGQVSWAINGVDVGLGNSVVVPYANFQLRLSSWQPTQVWTISNFAVSPLPQRFYQLQESPLE